MHQRQFCEVFSVRNPRLGRRRREVEGGEERRQHERSRLQVCLPYMFFRKCIRYEKLQIEQHSVPTVRNSISRRFNTSTRKNKMIAKTLSSLFFSKIFSCFKSSFNSSFIVNLGYKGLSDIKNTFSGLISMQISSDKQSDNH